MQLDEFETKNYKLKVVDVEGKEVYAVVNNWTGVEEYKDSLLPRAIEYLRLLDSELSKAQSEQGDTPELMIPKPPKVEFPH